MGNNPFVGILDEIDEEVFRIKNVLYAESADDPEGWKPKLNVYFSNKKPTESFAETVERQSSAFQIKSNQYKKASTGNLNNFERKIEKRIIGTIKDFTPQKNWIYKHHESPHFYKDEAEMEQKLRESWGEQVDFKNKKRIGKEYYYPLREKRSSLQDLNPFLVSEAEASGEESFGLRADSTKKGLGFFGVLENAGGGISTEISVGVNFDGQETEIPTLVPTLSKNEIDYLLEGNEPTPTIIKKAVEHAKKRIKEGKSPFAQEGEQITAELPAEGNPFAELSAEGNPFTGIIDEAQQISDNPFAAIIDQPAQPAEFKPETTFAKEAISGIIDDITAIPYRMLGVRAPAEGAFFQDTPSAIEWLDKTVGVKKEAVPGSYTKEAGWKYQDREIPRWEAMLETGVELTALALIGKIGLTTLLSSPRAQQTLSRIAFKPYTSGTPGTPTFIESSTPRKGYEWLARRIAPQHPAFQPIQMKSREDIILERYHLSPEGPEKEAARQIAKKMGIEISGEPVFKPAVGGELGYQKPVSPIKPAAGPKTLLSWTLKSGRIKTSFLTNILGKEWRESLPFSLASNKGRDPAELYLEAVKDGVISPAPEGYVGGVEQYFFDQLKVSKGKFLETTKEFEDGLAKEYEDFKLKEELTNETIREAEKEIGPAIKKEVDARADEEVAEFVESAWPYKEEFRQRIEKAATPGELTDIRDELADEVTETNQGEISELLAQVEGKAKYETKEMVEIKKTIRNLTTDELETFIDSRYEVGATQKELDFLETEWEGRVSEDIQSMTEEELNVGEDITQGSHLEESLVDTYERYLLSQKTGEYRGSSTEQIRDNFLEVLKEMSVQAPLKTVTNEQVFEAAKELYEAKQALIKKIKPSPLAVQPTMPPTPLRPGVPQAETPALTALKHGLSPEVQKTLFDNANDAQAKLSEHEKAGRLLLPGKETTDIQDPKLRAALYAGRRKLSYLGAGLVNWIKESAKVIWEGTRLEYEPTLKKWPQLQDDIRTGPITFARKGREQAELALGGLIGNLNGFQEDQFLNVIGMRDLIARGGEGITLPRDLKVADIQVELDRVLANAPQVTKDAVAKYDRLMSSIGQDLIAREKLSPDELKSNYFPHYVLDYLPMWWDETSAFLPKRLRTPYRQYTKHAVGSTKDIAISKEALTWHLTSIFMDNAIDDWAIEQLTKYNAFGLSPEQVQALGPIRPNQVIQVGTQKFRGFQYQPGRQVYPAQTTNPSALNKALEEGLSTQEWLASSGPRGGAPIRQGVALGRYNKTYLLPIEIYDRMAKLKAPYAENPFLQIALPATSLWKRITLDWAGIPFQINNLFGDFVNLYRESPGAAGEVGIALRIIKDLRHPDKLSEWQAHVLQTSHDKDVLGAGFVQEYAHISAGATPKGILERIERFSALREGIMRLAMLSYQMKRTEVGLPIVSPAFQANIQGLDKLSSAAYVARNFTVDYLAIPDWYKQWVRGFAAPFITFWHMNAKNWAKYSKSDVSGLFLKFIAPIVGLWAYNNTGERRKVEERLPDYWRFRPIRINLKTVDIDKDGEPDRALIWSMQTPIEMAGALIGLDRIGDKVTQMRAGKMTAKEAAILQLIDFGIGAPRTLHSLFSPLIQFFEGVSSNRDPRTRQEVIPSELERSDNFIKAPYYIRYFVEKMATPFGQYLKDQKGTEHTNMLLSGPLDVQRALGFYWVNLQTADARVEMDQTRKQRGDYDTYMYRIEQRYLEGRDYLDIEKEAATQGIALNPKNIQNRLTSTRVQIDKIKSQLRQTTDSLARRRLEIELNGLIEQRSEEYKKTVPKGAR